MMNDKYEIIVEKLINTPRFKKNADFITVKKVLEVFKYNDDLPVIHVAGTNGKGSVIAMIDSIFLSKGIRTGRFTSPHLVDIRERMVVNGELMTKEAFVSLYEELDEQVQRLIEQGYMRPTFFEWIFLMSMRHFKKANVKVVLLETGLGGRLDTTNVLNHKLVTVITSIGLDHIGGVLGESLEAIAREKGGIIRRGGIPTVLYNETDRVSKVIEDICMEKESKLYKVLPFSDKIFKRREESIDFSVGGNKYYNYEDLRSNAVIDYQLANVKIALTTVSLLSEYFEIEPNDVWEGLENFYWPGRLEYLSDNLVVDGGAHNHDGVKAFVKAMNQRDKDSHIDLVFACMADKQYIEMINELLSIHNLNKVYIPVTNFFTQEDAIRLQKAFNQNGYREIIIVENLEDLLRTYEQNVGGARTLLGCVGSLYLVGEVIKLKRRIEHD